MPEKPSYEALEKRVHELEKKVKDLQFEAVKYETLFNSFPHGITISDDQGNIIQTNEIAEQLLGVSRQEHESRAIDGREWRIIRPDGSDMPPGEWASVIALKEKRKVSGCEMGICRPGGKVTWLDVTAAPLPLEGHGVVITYNDISDKKEAEERFRLLVESSPISVMMLRNGKYTYGNPASAALLGFESPEEIIGLDALHSICPEYRDLIRQRMNRIKAGRFNEPVRIKIRKPDGETAWTMSTSISVRIDGEPTAVIFGQDVTERTAAEAALRESKARYEEVISMISDVVWRYDTDSRGQFVDSYISPVADRLLGLPQGTIGDRFDKYFSYIHPEDFPLVQETFQSAISSLAEATSLEYRVCCSDGTIKWVRSHGSAHLQSNGLVTAFGTTIDITEQKRLEEERTKSEETLRAIFDASPMAMVLLDKNGFIVDSNEKHANRLKTKREEILGKCVWNLLPNDVREHRKSQVETVFETGVPFSGEDKRGTIWNEYHIHPAIKNSKNDIQAVIVEALDITERKRVELALRHEEEKFRTLLENIVDWVWMVDKGGRYTYVSPQAKEILGYDVEEILGKTPFDFMSSEEVKRVAPIFSEAVENRERIFSLEDTLFAKDGSEVIFETNATPLFGRQGDMIGFMGTCRDITEQKRKEEELQESESRVRTKLNALLDPEGDIGALNLADVVDCDEIQSLMDDFYAFSDIGVGILDLDGNILVGTGYQDVCTKFHRVHPETAKRCRESDTKLSFGVEPGTFKIYKCKNNMWDMVTPIVVAGKHVGNLFLGQFFFEDEAPDITAFREQARRYGFDEDAYLKAYRSIPRWPRETVDRVMTFYCNLINVISRLSYAHIKLARTTEALRESEQKFRSFVENANDIVYALSPEGVFTYVSPNWIDFIGEPADEALGKSFEPYVHPEDVRVCRRFLEKVLATGEKQSSAEYRVRHRDGSWRWHVSNGSPIRGPHGGVEGYVGIGRDVTEQKLYEAERARLMSAVEQAAEMFLITDDKGTIQYVNPAFERATGYTAKEAVGQNPRILKSGKQDQSFYRHLWETILSGKNWQGRMTNRRKDGIFYVEEAAISPVFDGSGKIVNFVAVKRDITAELEMEEKIGQAQRLESIGTLAGGIAHDFNNILFPIIGLSELMLEDFDPASPEHENIAEILKAAKRGADLVRQILSFSRQAERQTIPLRMQPIVKEVLKLCRSTVPSDIKIEQNIRNECGQIMADPTQIHQIVMNLVTNAYHAVEKTGGRIAVSLEETAVSNGTIAEDDPEPGRYARLSVSDDGVGIPAEALEKIFDPYFTTKKKGKGTGLGLAVVYGIVKEYGGDLRVQTEVGKGTTFEVFLPLIQRAPGMLEMTSSEVKYETGTERILLVDDEEPIANLEKKMLERLGYRVSVRRSSIDALEAFRASPEKFDLLITDMTMPNMTGDQLAREVIAIKPDFPVIICTGFSERINSELAKAIGIKGFLMKPVIRKDLATLVRKALDEAKSHAQGLRTFCRYRF